MQYPGQSRNGLLKLTMPPVEQLINILLSVKGTVNSLVALQLVFWSIQLQLAGFHAEYHRRMQYSEKRLNFLLPYY